MNQYIHFTSFENFNSMLDSNTFRLYSFSNLSDINELELPLVLLINNILIQLDKKFEDESNNHLLMVLHFSIMILINNENIFKSNLSKEIYNKIIKNSNNLMNLKISDKNLDVIKNYIKLPNHFFVGSFNLIYDYNIKKKFSDNLRQNIRFNTMWDYYGKGYTGVGLLLENDFNYDKPYGKNFIMNNSTINYILDSQQTYYNDFDDFFKSLNNIEINKISNDLLDLYVNQHQYLLFDFDTLLQEIKLLEKNNFSLSLENKIEDTLSNTLVLLKYSFEFIKLIIEKSLFIKEKKYEHEKEMRLIVENPFFDFNYKEIKIDFNKQSSYVEVGLTKLLNNKLNFSQGKKTKIVLGEKNPLQANTSLRYLYEQKYNLEFLNIIE